MFYRSFIACLFALAAWGLASASQLTLTGAGVPSNAFVPIGTPNGIGSNTAAYTTLLATGSMTTTAAIPAGSLAVVICATNADTQPPCTAVTDGTNTYTKQIGTNTTFSQVAIWYKENASAVSSGATITVTFTPTGAGAGNFYNLAAATVTGILTSGSSDQTAHQETSTNAPTATTGTLAQSNEIAFGAVGQVSAGTFTGASGWTTLYNLNSGSQPMLWQYKTVAATTAVTFNPTSSVTQGAPLVVGTFKGN